MKKIFLTLSFILITVWADAQFCNKYADKAVSQYNLAKQQKIPTNNGYGWTDNWKAHYNWCLKVSESTANGRTQRRQSYIDDYLKKNGTPPLHKDKKENTQTSNVTNDVLKDMVKNQPKFQTIPVIVAETPDVNVVPSVTTIPFNTDFVRLLSSEKYTVGHNLSAVGNGDKESSSVYRDRNFLYWKTPSYLEGLDYLITRNQDKFTSGNNFFTIHHPKTTHPVIAYVAIDSQLTPPAWLIKQGYTNLYDQITIVIPENVNNRYQYFKLYKKIFPQGGDMVFGGNQNGQNQKQGNMYLVFFNTKVKTSIDLKNKFKGSIINGTGTIKVTKKNRANFVEDLKEGQKNKNEDLKNNKICSTEIRSLKGNNSSLFLLSDQRDSDLFPGNILSISEIESGNYTKALTPARKPYNISTNMIGNLHPVAKVTDATLDDYRIAKSKLLNFKHDIGPRVSLGEYKSVQSAVDFAVKTSGSFRYFIYSGGASASFQETTKKNHYEITIDKIYYSIDFTPNRNDFFKDPNIPNNNDWVYVSNVQYGTKLILDIESDYSEDDVRTALNFKVDAGVISGGGNTSFRYKEILKNMKIKVIALGEMSKMGVNHLISNPKDPKTFADVFSNSKINAYTQLYPLSYTLKFVDDHKIAQLETSAKYTQQKCRKISNILEFEFHDIYVVESDDESDGEDLRGWMKIRPWGYSEKEVFNQKFEENKEGGESPILLSPNKIYYFKYSPKGLDDPMKNLEIEAHLMEDDDGSADDDFGHTLVRIPLNKIFSGALYDKQTLDDIGLAVPNKWKASTLKDNTCNECLVMPFSHDDSKVLIRFKIDLPDKLPAGKSFSN